MSGFIVLISKGCVILYKTTKMKIKKNFSAHCLFVIFYSLSFYSNSQPINWDSVRAAYFEKFQPTDTPAWLFPIIFESGKGQRDTVYIGYDTDAYDITQPGFDGDSVFGEKKIWIDTTKFNADVTGNPCNGMGIVCDSVIKCIIRSPIEVIGTSFSLGKSRYPLKMFWDKNLFYSDSLPFYKDSTSYPDTLPKAIGKIGCGDNNMAYINCYYDWSFFMPADPQNKYAFINPSCPFIPPSSPPDPYPYASGAPCWVTDSIVWYGDSIYHPDDMAIGFVIVQYGDGGIGIDEKMGSTAEDFILYPNPSAENIKIKGQNDIFSIEIYDITQRLMLKDQATTNEKNISLRNFPNGFYTVKIISRSKQYYYKIIKVLP